MSYVVIEVNEKQMDIVSSKYTAYNQPRRWNFLI